jgi:hypothetical protein
VIADFSEVPFPFVPKSERNGLWMMNFDGARARHGLGEMVVLTSPSGITYRFSSRLEFYCPNNMEKYKSLLLGL